MSRPTAQASQIRMRLGWPGGMAHGLLVDQVAWRRTGAAAIRRAMLACASCRQRVLEPPGVVVWAVYLLLQIVPCPDPSACGACCGSMRLKGMSDIDGIHQSPPSAKMVRRFSRSRLLAAQHSCDYSRSLSLPALYRFAQQPLSFVALKYAKQTFRKLLLPTRTP